MAAPISPVSPSFIPASSHRQAMDWSLALISQGIESTIVKQLDDGGWGLVVPPEAHQVSAEIIQQYRAENRGWRWRRAIFQTGFHFEWTAIAWVLLIVFFFWLDSRLNLRPWGVANRLALTQGEWWRLFTAVWLHADPPHLASNAVFGVMFLGLSMGRYGAGLGLFAAYLAAAAGNLFRCLLSLDQSSSLGASGMVMGALGLLAAQSFWLWRRAPQTRKYVLGGILSGVMFLTLFGLSPGTDVIAHVGGFLIGLLLGFGLAGKPTSAIKPLLNLICGALFAVLVVVPWLLALRRLG
jgi:membrane associated rhomboid family serine protease